MYEAAPPTNGKVAADRKDSDLPQFGTRNARYDTRRPVG